MPRVTIGEGEVAAGPAIALAEAAVPDLAEVRGQHGARRALEIALAGGHGLLLTGPPGVGKTLLARTIPGLLPPLDDRSALAATIIASAAGEGPIRELRRRAPFRAPHHTVPSARTVPGRPHRLSADPCLRVSSAHRGSRTEGADVKIINTDGMAFIGPGSEWFWTALSGLVLAVTFIAIYRQLALARGANAREQLESSDREWDSERFALCKLEVLLARRDSTDQAKVPGAPALAIANFWERIAALARGGHLDPALLHAYNGGACPIWWVALAPWVRQLRAGNEDETEYNNFEWLAGVMDELDRRAGASAFNETLFASQLPSRIAAFQDRLRFEQSLRTVKIASPEPVPTAPPAIPAVAEG